MSVEKEKSAHETLRLRAFLRDYRKRNGHLPREYVEFHAGRSSEPDWSQIDGAAWKLAEREARRLELGTEPATDAIENTIELIRGNYDDTILIGGPPCQAYSLVGRARSRGTKGYRPENDDRHFLFREYIRVLDRLRPAVFVMENVKGMLSSIVKSERVFEMLMDDLSSLGGGDEHAYELRALVSDGKGIALRTVSQASDFIVRAEDFGVPQRRHRVIIVGIRSDLAARAEGVEIERTVTTTSTVESVVADMPKLRSGISPQRDDGPAAWAHIIRGAALSLAEHDFGSESERLHERFSAIAKDGVDQLQRSSKSLPADYGVSNDPLRNWLECSELEALAHHETRGHMDSDLARYLFVSVFGEQVGRSPKASDFPDMLAPDHRSWSSGKFADRFRVQLAGEAATTITSHISKDGHYFIHPDPTQCRSLTVREAARIQTFPDDYLFLGNRTQQYVQVGNAVPPYLARQIAAVVHAVLRRNENAQRAVGAGERNPKTEPLSA
nr:DNA (cytosine-5-)-methyltransferase [Sphingomicrobium sp. B8]